MQIKSRRLESYNSFAVADSASQEARARLKKRELFQQLNLQGCSPALCLQAIAQMYSTSMNWVASQVLNPDNCFPERAVAS